MQRVKGYRLEIDAVLLESAAGIALYRAAFRNNG
jgi:hypothetical protein